MATQVSNPCPKPYTPPASQAGAMPAPASPAAIPSKGTLPCPSPIERQAVDVYSPSMATPTPPTAPASKVSPNFGNKPAQPKFSGKLGAAAGGVGGFALTAAICWPLAIGAGLLGLLIHPLLPIAGLLGLAPFVGAAFGAWMGSGSSSKK